MDWLCANCGQTIDIMVIVLAIILIGIPLFGEVVIPSLGWNNAKTTKRGRIIQALLVLLLIASLIQYHCNKMDREKLNGKIDKRLEALSNDVQDIKSLITTEPVAKQKAIKKDSIGYRSNSHPGGSLYRPDLSLSAKHLRPILLSESNKLSALPNGGYEFEVSITAIDEQRAYSPRARWIIIQPSGSLVDTVTVTQWTLPDKRGAMIKGISKPYYLGLLQNIPNLFYVMLEVEYRDEYDVTQPPYRKIFLLDTDALGEQNAVRMNEYYEIIKHLTKNKVL